MLRANSLPGQDVVIFSSVIPAHAGKNDRICCRIQESRKMSAPKCPVCKGRMVRNGMTAAGKQRWKCTACRATSVHRIANDAKRLDEFLAWLLSKQRMADMPGQGRTFRRRTADFWAIWPLPPLIDEIHRVVYVNGIHLGRRAVVLIACSDEHVLGWYLAREENARAWDALLSRIAPPDMVVTDGGSGFEKARRRAWPDTRVQRCAFHAFCQVRRYTTSRPRLQAGAELYGIAKDLLAVRDREQAAAWLAGYRRWCERWDGFLAEETIVDGRRELTHERLVKAKISLNRLINSDRLFTYLDEWLTLGGPMPATNNRIEGGVNAPLRQMLREHRGLSLLRRIKAVYWWCYMHTECRLGAADILKVMPTDDDIAAIYRRLDRRNELSGIIPKWGDAVMWSELHMIDYSHDAFRHDWD